MFFLFQFGIAGLSLLGHDERLFKVNPVFCMPEAVIERLGIKIQQLKLWYTTWINDHVILDLTVAMNELLCLKKCGRLDLTTITTGPGFLWDFVLLLLKTCSLYHEKLFIKVVNDISTQVFNNFFSASDLMEAVRGR